MILIVGLGNPGKKYDLTRHNAGFFMIDKLKEKYGFPDLKLEKKFKAEISKGEISGKDIILVKPQTFMNESGAAVRTVLDFYKLTPDNIMVIHDDLDIELGKYKIADDSRSAGHNGVRDIIEKLGTQRFRRIRVGISKPAEEKAACPLSGHDYVLGKFSPEELETLEKVSKEVLEETEKLLSQKNV